jgi:hypothetical protein
LLTNEESSQPRAEIAELQRDAVAVDATPSAVLATLKRLTG